MLGICLVGFTVRVAIAIRNTGLVFSSRSDQSAFSQQFAGRETQASWGNIWEPQSAAMIRLRLTIKTRDEMLQRNYIADDG